jgi:cytochrome c oxidase subunit 2
VVVPIAYFGFFLWLVMAYKDKMLPVAASEHGAEVDWLLNFNWLILAVAFIITNVLLFWFAGKYIYSKDRRAYWQPHNNKLELAWTVIPASVLAVIIIYGLNSWTTITAPASPDAWWKWNSTPANSTGPHATQVRTVALARPTSA